MIDQQTDRQSQSTDINSHAFTRWQHTHSHRCVRGGRATCISEIIMYNDYFVTDRGGFRGGVTGARPPPLKPGVADRPAPIFSSPCQRKRERNLSNNNIDSEIFLSLTALVHILHCLWSPKPIVLSKNTCSQLVIIYIYIYIPSNMTFSITPFTPLPPLPNRTPKRVIFSLSPPFRSVHSLYNHLRKTSSSNLSALSNSVTAACLPLSDIQRRGNLWGRGAALTTFMVRGKDYSLPPHFLPTFVRHLLHQCQSKTILLQA